MDLFSIGFPTALSVGNLFYCFIGVLLGTFFGVLPGIGPLAAVSLLFPFTFALDPVPAIIMLAGIYYGSEYGGSTASILLNLPGGASSAVTCLDGYPMAQQGRAGVALFVTAIASFVGGSIGILVLMWLAPLLADAALSFGYAEYFAAMLLGLLAAAFVGRGSPLKGIAMLVLGLLIGCMGVDANTGVRRFVFGIHELSDGIDIMVVAIGLFGVSEMIAAARENSGSVRVHKVAVRSMIPDREDTRRSIGPTLRGTLIGSVLGVLPGTGPTLASFLSYAVEKRISREPNRFGAGAVEGIAAPEASNNAAAQTAFVPTLSLGIPGSATMAIMLGALLIHGVTPGPMMMNDHPELFWGLIASFWIGNLMLLVLNIPLIGMWVRLLSVPFKVLLPAIIVLICIGAYAMNNSAFDIWLVLVFGILGYVLRQLDFPLAPILLGLILGPLLETNFRSAMLLADGDVLELFRRPIAGSLLAVAIAITAWTAVSTLYRRHRPEPT